MKDIKKLLGSWNDGSEIENFRGSKDHKFLNRDRTIKSNWVRLHTYASEILLNENKMKILDIGSGNGSTLEIFRYYGHDVIGMDYSPGLIDENTWLYEPMFKSQNLHGVIHSGSDLPYPFQDKEFDLVICWGAITFFKPVETWPSIMNEFARLSKNTILVGANVGSVYELGKIHLDNWSHNEFSNVMKKGSLYKWSCK